MKISPKDTANKLRTRVLSLGWSPYSHLFLKDDGSTWVLSAEMRALTDICGRLPIQTEDARMLPYVKQQAVFYASRYELLLSDIWKVSTHHLATAYFHGRPGTTREPVFDEIYGTLKRAHPHIQRIQVSHSEMRDVVLSTGVDPQKVFLIPIGIDIEAFQMQTVETKKTARSRFGIPESAMVVGSFQKDGVGWEEGNEPKLIKGPDIFLAVINLLKQQVPELFVLLTGPARGYVIRGLQERNVPFKHIQFENNHAINEAYQALDLYMVASRQEGGPKALLESMAAGVPLVTTRVGQAMDLVSHGVNAWMTEVENVEGLAYWAQAAMNQDKADREQMIRAARRTAEENSYMAQTPLWRKFMEGFVSSR
jgi:glycosyltransferase involved in cell wall biosynthesis